MPVAAARWISAIVCGSKVAEGRGGVVRAAIVAAFISTDPALSMWKL